MSHLHPSMSHLSEGAVYHAFPCLTTCVFSAGASFGTKVNYGCKGCGFNSCSHAVFLSRKHFGLQCSLHRVNSKSSLKIELRQGATMLTEQTIPGGAVTSATVPGTRNASSCQHKRQGGGGRKKARVLRGSGTAKINR